MAKDDLIPSKRDDRVVQIIERLEQAVVEKDQHHDRKVAGLLLRIVLDRRHVILTEELIDAIAESRGADARRVVELLRRRCEEAAVEFAAKADDAEEDKAGTWTPAMMTTLGTGLASMTAVLISDDAPVVAGLLAVGLLVAAGFSWGQRRALHRVKKALTLRSDRLRILIGALDRRSRP